jgi:hypothetical protein
VDRRRPKSARRKEEPCDSSDAPPATAHRHHRQHRRSDSDSDEEAPPPRKSTSTAASKRPKRHSHGELSVKAPRKHQRDDDDGRSEDSDESAAAADVRRGTTFEYEPRSDSDSEEQQELDPQTVLMQCRVVIRDSITIEKTEKRTQLAVRGFLEFFGLRHFYRQTNDERGDGQRVQCSQYWGLLILADRTRLPLQYDFDPNREEPAIAALEHCAGNIVTLGPLTLRRLEPAPSTSPRGRATGAKFTLRMIPMFRDSPAALVLTKQTVWREEFSATDIDPLPWSDPRAARTSDNTVEKMLAVTTGDREETRSKDQKVVGYAYPVDSRYGDVFVRTWASAYDPMLGKRLKRYGSVVTVYNVDEGFLRDQRPAFNEGHFTASIYHGKKHELESCDNAPVAILKQLKIIDSS